MTKASEAREERRKARAESRAERKANHVPRPFWVVAIQGLVAFVAAVVLLTHAELFSVYKGHSPKSGKVGISAAPAMIEGLYRVDILRRYRKARGLVDDTARVLHLPRELFRGAMSSAGLQHYALSRAELQEYAEAVERLDAARARRKESDDAEFKRTGMRRKKKRRTPLRLDYEYPDMSFGKAWKRTKAAVRAGSDRLRKVMRKSEKSGRIGWILSGGVSSVIAIVVLGVIGSPEDFAFMGSIGLGLLCFAFGATDAKSGFTPGPAIFVLAACFASALALNYVYPTEDAMFSSASGSGAKGKAAGRKGGKKRSVRKVVKDDGLDGEDEDEEGAAAEETAAQRKARLKKEKKEKKGKGKGKKQQQQKKKKQKANALDNEDDYVRVDGGNIPKVH